MFDLRNLRIEIDIKISPIRVIVETGHPPPPAYRVEWIVGPITKRS